MDRKIIILSLILILSVLGSGALHAQKVENTDILFLKNGMVYQGKVLIYQPNKNVFILVKGSYKSIRADEIDHILFGKKKEHAPFVYQEKEDHDHQLFQGHSNNLTASLLWTPPFYIGGGINYTYLYHFSPLLGIGATVGVDINSYCSKLPLGIAMRGYLMPESSSFYYDLSMGYSFLLKDFGELTSRKIDNTHFFMRPALGFRVSSIEKSHLTIDVGVNMQWMETSSFSGYYPYSSIQSLTFIDVRLGCTF